MVRCTDSRMEVVLPGVLERGTVGFRKTAKLDSLSGGGERWVAYVEFFVSVRC